MNFPSSQAATQPPLWRFLLDPKLRLSLHENRRVPPPTATVGGSTRDDVALWKWRMRLERIMTDGATTVSRSGTAADDVLYGPGRKNAYSAVPKLGAPLVGAGGSSPAAVAAVDREHNRFVARTLAPNLVALLEQKCRSLMAAALSPLDASAVGVSRFDGSARLAQLLELERAVGTASASTSTSSTASNSDSAEGAARALLKSESVAWKLNLAWMEKQRQAAQVGGVAGTAAEAPVSATAPLQLSQQVYIDVTSRIAQLCSLEETPDAAGAHASRAEFLQVAARDWATVTARRGGGAAPLPFVQWFALVLLPVCLILAPAASCGTTEGLFSHCVAVCQALRRILFPSDSVGAAAMQRAYEATKRGDSATVAAAAQSPNSSPHTQKQQRRRPAAVVVVGGSKSDLIYASAVCSQRLAPTGLAPPTPQQQQVQKPGEHEEATSPLAKNTRASSLPPVAARRSVSPSAAAAPSPTRPSAAAQRPVTSPSSALTAAVVIDHTTVPRRTPRAFQQLLEKAAAAGPSAAAPSPARVLPFAASPSPSGVSSGDSAQRSRRRRSPADKGKLDGSAQRERPLLHLCVMDFSNEGSAESPRPVSAALPCSLSVQHSPAAAAGATAPGSGARSTSPVGGVHRTIVDRVPRELAHRKLVAIRIGSELRLDAPQE